MKALLVTLALLALAASAASTYTGCPCAPHLPPPPMHPPPPPMHPMPPPPMHPCPCHPVGTPPHHPCPCHPVGTPPHHPCPCHPVGTPPPNLGQCVELLRYQCSPTATPSCSPQCNALRQQCCQQLRQVDPVYRYQAIFGVALQQQPHGHPLGAVMAAQIAQQLLQVCGLQQQPWDVHH